MFREALNNNLDEYTDSVTGFIRKCIEDVVPTKPVRFAYRQNRSTDDAVALTLHTALSHLDKKNSYVRMLFVDSAFNTIVSLRLDIKLKDLGLNSSLSSWILNFLTDRRQVVKEEVSFLTTTEVPGENNLSLNVNKTKELIVDFRKQERVHTPITITGAAVERVISFKFLCVHITEELTWSEHTTRVVKKAQQRLFFLRRLRRFGMDPRTLRTFYTCTVESILPGSITTWYGSCTAIERKALQRVVRTAQYITGVQLPNLLDLYTSRCLWKTRRVVKDSTHPSHCLFSQLPSGRRFRTGVSAVTTVTGHRGHSVQIRCSYESGYETYMKYLCRGECSTKPWGKKDIPVQSGSTAKDQRFSLHDDTAARVFTITITDLRPEDEGRYWCGIQRPYSLLDIFTEILLLVILDPPPSVSHSTYPPPSSVQTQPTRPRPLTPTDIQSAVTPRRDAGGDIDAADYENDVQGNQHSMAMGTVYQSLNPNTNQSDAVYQSLNPNTNQTDSVYQSLNPNTNQTDSVYQSLNPNTNQSDSLYQSLDPNTNKSDSVYQSLNPNTK
ncbi:hypothetical protein NFI96_014985 [Prochilodus magdalenae]|nr:hypothetical protein NFI96_014985 [Prochilodus magdalenae]